MADDLAADDVGSDLPPLVSHKPGGTGSLSVMEAARSYADWKAKLAAGEDTNVQPEREAPPPKAPPPPPPAAKQSAVEADANPETDHGETPEPEAVAEPPIEAPLSWKAAEKERWQSIPRETQEYIVQREMERERHLTTSSKEAADQLKGLQAREQAMEQARQQYEQLAAANLVQLQQQLAGEFADIKSDHDISRLAVEDPNRYLRWDAHQKRMAAQISAMQQAQQRQQQERNDYFARYAAEADKKFIASNPEFADPEKAAKIQAVAVSALRDVGFSEDELAQHWNGQAMLSMRDPRVQSMFADAARYRMGQEAVKRVAAKPLPPVQRPGVAQDSNPDVDRQIRSVQQQLDRASGTNALRLAVQLNALQREAGSRR